MNIRHRLRIALWLSAVPIVAAVAAQGPTQKPDPLDEPFKGVTTNGTVTPGLFPIRSTGVSTAPVRNAAVAFLASLSPEQRAKTAFPVDDLEWRKWNNVHRYVRQGVSFKEMSEEQRARAFGLLGAGLSAKGLEKSRNIMRLNETIAEMTKRFEEYGEGLYNLTVMGEPSDTKPWGWQLDGHHLIINYFVLRDQVVMTPAFMGSEPIHADAGKYAGTTVMQDEQNKGLALMLALTPDQQKKATLQPEKTANNSLAQAFRDNLVLDYAGLRAQELTGPQTTALRRPHRRVRRQHVRRTREGPDGGSAEASERHLLRLDRRHGSRRGVLLPHPQPSHPDRVRPPDAGRASGAEGARPHPRPQRRQNAERERLRQGSAAPALRGAPERSGPRAPAIAP